MSKIVYSLRFLLLITLLAIVFFATKTKPAFATGCKTIGDLIVCTNPEQIYTDTKLITFRITATKDNILGPALTYSALIWIDGAKPPSPSSNPPISSLCGDSRTNFYQHASPDPTGAELVFAFEPFIACKKVGRYHLMMWIGTTNLIQTLPDAIMISDYLFEIEQIGGGTLRLEVVKTPLGLTETTLPQVTLYNARKDNKYEFWWEGSGEFALNIPNTTYPAQDGNVKLDIPKKGIDFSKPGIRTLCMKIGEDIVFGTENRIIPGTECAFKVPFDFKATPVPDEQPPSDQPPPADSETQGSCKIEIGAAHLPNPKDQDSLSAVIKNLPTLKEFKVILTIKDQETIITKDPITDNPSPITTTSNKTGVINTPLVEHISLGNYTIKVTDANSTPLCWKDFEVTLEGSFKAVSDICKTGICTTVGEKVKCGTTQNPGIKTAIGCIHTNPPELVKDVMTFIIGISGGLAFLLMLLGAFQMLTSAGNPETLHAGRERLTSAIIGLLIVIFAILLLQTIGVGILKLPGF